mmetsp:Transcript_11014/g.35092  ORF Transcript_11014/g.35092 Transcript_11014/m.35092 type:complete len:292 (-) Transcript_11014:470-1345(-)
MLPEAARTARPRPRLVKHALVDRASAGGPSERRRLAGTLVRPKGQAATAKMTARQNCSFAKPPHTKPGGKPSAKRSCRLRKSPTHSSRISMPCCAQKRRRTKSSLASLVPRIAATSSSLAHHEPRRNSWRRTVTTMMAAALLPQPKRLSLASSSRTTKQRIAPPRCLCLTQRSPSSLVSQGTLRSGHLPLPICLRHQTTTRRGADFAPLCTTLRSPSSASPRSCAAGFRRSLFSPRDDPHRATWCAGSSNKQSCAATPFALMRLPAWQPRWLAPHALSTLGHPTEWSSSAR